MIAGVCSGLADYFGIDPILVRIFFVISLFVSGIGLLTYILLWIVSDYSPYQNESYRDRPGRSAKNTLGYILIMAGTLFLLDYLIPDIDGQIIFGISLLAIGGAMIYRNINKSSLREQQI